MKYWTLVIAVGVAAMLYALFRGLVAGLHIAFRLFLFAAGLLVVAGALAWLGWR